MKFTISNTTFLQGLQRVQNIVGAHPTLPALSNVLIEATAAGKIELTTNNIELSVATALDAKVDKPGTLSIPAKRLVAIVKELEGPEVVCEANTKTMEITSGRSVFKLFGLPKEEFPIFQHPQNPKEGLISEVVLKEAFDLTAFAVSTDETRLAITGVLIELGKDQIFFVGTDGRRLAVQTIDNTTGIEGSFTIPSRFITEIQRLLGEDEVKIKLTPNCLVLESPTYSLIGKLLDTTYPNFRQVIPAPEKITATAKFKREAVLSMVKRAAILTTDKTSSMRFMFSKNLLEVKSSTNEIGEAKEETAIEYTGEPLTIAFNPNYVLDVLKHISEETVEMDLIDDKSPAVVRLKQYNHIIMPMKTA